MNDSAPILSALDSITGSAVLVSVVSARGSTYRGIGARMLIWLDEAGEWRNVGTISGGCLEFDVMEHAREALHSGKTRVVEYDTEEDDEEKLWGLGLGCNGVLQAVLEVVDNHSPIISVLRAAQKQRQDVNICTLVQSPYVAIPPGLRLVLSVENERGQTVIHYDVRLDEFKENLPLAVQDWVRTTLIRQEGSVTLQTELNGEQWTFCFERQKPPLSLYIVGAGFDVIPVTTFAAMLGWDVTLADYRPVYAHKGRFPAAREIILQPLDDLIHSIEPPEGSAVLLMSHNFGLDSALFQRLVQRPLLYLGVLGPKERMKKILSECTNAGITISTSDKNKIFSPIGLDVGTETPEEIALSIIAEIQAVFHGRKGGFLRTRRSAIHQRGG